MMTTGNNNGVVGGCSMGKRIAPDETDPKMLKRRQGNRLAAQRLRSKRVEDKAESDKRISDLEGEVSSLTGQVSFLNDKVARLEIIIHDILKDYRLQTTAAKYQIRKLQELEQSASAQGLPTKANSLTELLAMMESGGINNGNNNHMVENGIMNSTVRSPIGSPNNQCLLRQGSIYSNPNTFQQEASGSSGMSKQAQQHLMLQGAGSSLKGSLHNAQVHDLQSPLQMQNHLQQPLMVQGAGSSHEGSLQNAQVHDVPSPLNIQNNIQQPLIFQGAGSSLQGSLQGSLQNAQVNNVVARPLHIQNHLPQPLMFQGAGSSLLGSLQNAPLNNANGKTMNEHAFNGVNGINQLTASGSGAVKDGSTCLDGNPIGFENNADPSSGSSMSESDSSNGTANKINSTIVSSGVNNCDTNVSDSDLEIHELTQDISSEFPNWWENL